MKKTFVGAVASAVLFLIAFQNCGKGFSTLGEVSQMSSQSASVCVPDSTQACLVQNGSGLQTCGANAEYGSCVANSCDAGFYVNGDVCAAGVIGTCAVGSSAACAEGNGTGLKACNADGTAYEGCVLSVCNAGYVLNGGKCSQCAAGSYYSNGVCVPNVCNPGSSATCAGGNGTGVKFCNTVGSGYGTCLISSCNSDFTLTDGLCVANPTYPYTVGYWWRILNETTIECRSSSAGYQPLPGVFPPIEKVVSNYLSTNGALFYKCDKLAGVSGIGLQIFGQDTTYGDIIGAGGKVYVHQPVSNFRSKALTTEVVGAQSSGFKAFGGNYYRDDASLFYVRLSVTSAPQIAQAAINGANLGTVSLVGSGLLKTDIGVYFNGVKTIVEKPSAFQRIGLSSYYQDGTKVYHLSGLELAVSSLAPADVQTFGTSSRYAKSCSNNAVEYFGATVIGADCASIAAAPGTFMAKDINSCYRSGVRIGPATAIECNPPAPTPTATPPPSTTSP